MCEVGWVWLLLLLLAAPELEYINGHVSAREMYRWAGGWVCVFDPDVGGPARTSEYPVRLCECSKRTRDPAAERVLFGYAKFIVRACVIHDCGCCWRLSS